MNSNVLLAWPNNIDSAISVTGGLYTSSLPLSNVRNRVLSKRARTVDTAESSSTFDIRLKGEKVINAFAIASHNITTGGSIRLRFYSNETQTELLHDSGIIDVWPALFSTDQLEWEFSNFWDGTVSEDDAKDITPLFTYILTAVLIPVSIKVEIFDTGNPDNYVEFGRVFIGESFQPFVNMQLGANIGFSINTEIELAQDNTEYYDRKRPRRVASFTLPTLKEDEAFSKLFSMQRTQGIDKEILFVYRNTQDSVMFSRTFLGRLQQTDPINQPYLDRYSTQINLIEII